VLFLNTQILQAQAKILCVISSCLITGGSVNIFFYKSKFWDATKQKYVETDYSYLAWCHDVLLRKMLPTVRREILDESSRDLHNS